MSGKAVLIVDDEEAIVHLLSRVISHLGVRVHAFCDSIEARKAWNSIHDDVFLVIADYKMPGLNGMELLQSIRSENSDVCLVLISADMPSKEREVADRFIDKPFFCQRSLTLSLKPMSTLLDVLFCFCAWRFLLLQERAPSFLLLFVI